MIRHRAGIKPLDPATFRAIADLAYRESGLRLVMGKAPMMQSRLHHRLAALGLANFQAYAALLESDSGIAERRQLISALTTNVSHFFREPHHFNALNALVEARMPALHKGDALRIWSAGCSNGQEPLSAAISLLHHFPHIAQFDVRILATDIDPKVIAFANAGIYPERLLNGLNDAQRSEHFSALRDTAIEPQFLAEPHLRALIHFKELNLLGDWPMKAQFDAVFCRNTVIYFDMATQTTLWPRLRQCLKPHGKLFLGHSERIPSPVQYGFINTDVTTYNPISTT